MFLFNITDIIESRETATYGLGKKNGGLAKIWTVKVDSLDSGWLSCGALHGRPCNMFVLFCSIRSKHISHFPSISAPTSEKCLCST